MNTVLPAVHCDEHSDVQPHSPPPVVAQRASPSVSLLDQLAMRIGLALLTWGRRRGSVDVRREVRAHRERDRARELRERAAEREYRLLATLR